MSLFPERVAHLPNDCRTRQIHTMTHTGMVSVEPDWDGRFPLYRYLPMDSQIYYPPARSRDEPMRRDLCCRSCFQNNVIPIMRNWNAQMSVTMNPLFQPYLESFPTLVPSLWDIVCSYLRCFLAH